MGVQGAKTPAGARGVLARFSPMAGRRPARRSMSGSQYEHLTGIKKYVIIIIKYSGIYNIPIRPPFLTSTIFQQRKQVVCSRWSGLLQDRKYDACLWECRGRSPLPEREVSSLHPSFLPPQAAKGTLQQPWVCSEAEVTTMCFNYY